MKRYRLEFLASILLLTSSSINVKRTGRYENEKYYDDYCKLKCLYLGTGMNEADHLKYCRGKDSNDCGKEQSCHQNQCVPHGKKSRQT